MKRSDIPIMLHGISTCIETAFANEKAFLDRFADGAEQLGSIYMASERTAVTTETGGCFTQETIPTDDFIEWVFEQRKADWC